VVFSAFRDKKNNDAVSINDIRKKRHSYEKEER
jgi:hypothetical protein